jgi:subtilisin-like proprotein convertase family protein
MLPQRPTDHFVLSIWLCCGLGLASCSNDVGETGDPDPGSSSSDPSTTENPPTTNADSSSSGEPTGDTEASDTDPNDTDTSGSSDGSASSSESSSDGVPECDDDAQCDDSASCTEDHCVAGACVSTDLDGVPAPESEQLAGDCMAVSCVAGEPSDGIDDEDLPVDADDCTADVCTDGVPSHPTADLPMCVPEPVCNDGLDEDLDGNADCLDSDCDGIAGCELGTELTCNDGIDNDADGDPDCVDVDCGGISGCELGNELTCNDGIDNDSDGNLDCNDGDCFGSAACVVPDEIQCNDGIDNDSDGLLDGAEANCGWVNTAMACAVGHAFGFSATDLPQSIPSVGSSTRNSYILVAIGGTVATAAVRIDISHTYDSDLDILLLSPSATSRELSTDNGGAGGSGDNFSNTVFSDSGAGVIGTAGFDNPPYADTYRPEQAFAPTLTGQTTDGSWNLQVSDQFNLDGGTINTFQLGICTE